MFSQSAVVNKCIGFAQFIENVRWTHAEPLVLPFSCCVVPVLLLLLLYTTRTDRQTDTRQMQMQRLKAASVKNILFVLAKCA